MDPLARKLVRDTVRACTNCALHTVGSGPVPFSGPSPCQIAIVGEAPGATEDVEGRPFVGPSGKLAQSWLASSGLLPDDCAWLNVVSCFPNRTPTSQEVAACQVNLRSQLELIAPSFILVLGGVASNAFIPSIRIGDIHGLFWSVTENLSPGCPVSAWCLSTWHPAAVLRNPALQADVTADVRRFAALANGAYSPYSYGNFCLVCSRSQWSWETDAVATHWTDANLPYCDKHWPANRQMKGSGREHAKPRSVGRRQRQAVKRATAIDPAQQNIL